MMNEVMGPDMVSMLGSSPDAGPIVQPQSPPLGLLLGTFRPSCRQSLSTRLWLTSQPSRRSSAVIRRWPWRPNCVANATIRRMIRGSFSGVSSSRRCVDRGCLITRHARRSETPKRSRVCSTALRRFDGLRSFPGIPPRESACRATDRPRASSGARSPSRAL